MVKKILVAACLLILLIAAFIIKTISDAGEFKTINPHFNGTTVLLSDLAGAEDITIDYDLQQAYISADDRFATRKGKEGAGNIYFLDLMTDTALPVSANYTLPFPLHPHGISLFKKDGVSYLYVVNHAKGRHAIVVFGSGTNALTIYQDSVFMISPNDVLAVDEKRFYFTNDHGSRTPTGVMLESYLRLKKSNVIYYDGENYSVAAEGIAYANGINMSRDGKEVYVASSIGGSVLIYHRDSTSGKLTWKDEIKLKSGADNIELDEQGNLWVACHPQLLTFVKHAEDTSKLSPSQVFKRNATGSFTPEEIFLSKGDDLSASSVAAVSGNTMLIGSVMDRGILKCKMK